MFNSMKPDAVYKDIPSIPLDELKNRGIRFLFLDFDNTLGPDRATSPDEFSYKCVDLLRNNGFELCLVSNAKSGRSAVLSKALNLKGVTYAKKPGTSGVRRALALMKAEPSNSCMIGDQVFTDVIAGKKAGLYTIMVEKYQKHEIWYVAIKRPLEKIVRLIFGF